MVLLNSHRVPRVPWYLGNQFRKSDEFSLQDCHPLWGALPDSSIINQVCNFPTNPKLRPIRPHDTGYTTFSDLTYIRFGLFPFRSPLLWKSRLFSLPEDTKMFQFSSLASTAYVFSCRCLDITRDGLPHSEISGSKFV